MVIKIIMGIIGSKDNLGQIATIVGYNASDFRWMDYNDRTVYQTGGLLFEYQSKKFIITVRSKIISCRNIMMYYSPFDDKKTILKNDLYVLFQSIEHGLIILGTKNKIEFDSDSSDIIHGESSKGLCKSYNVDFQNLVPTKRTQYYTARIDFDLESHLVTYNAQIYTVKYKESFFNYQTYLPVQYFHRFKLENNKKNDLCGIIGAVIFHKKHNNFKLVGMIDSFKKNTITAIPSKMIFKTIHDSVSNLNSMDQYMGTTDLPISYKISKNSELKIYKKFSSLRKDDKIISIQNQQIIIENDEPKILDPDYKILIPLDLYLRLNLEKNTQINLNILRKNEKIDLSIYGVPISQSRFPITNQPFYFPTVPIPYINFHGIIIVEFTHELLDIMAMHKIEIKNTIIKKFFTEDLNEKYLFIIDCKNKLLLQTYKFLPDLHPDKKKKFTVPILGCVNQKSVRSLQDLNSTIQNLNKFKLVHDNNFVDMVNIE